MATTSKSVAISKKLYDCYKKYGMKAAIQIAVEILDLGPKIAGDTAPMLNGEICETLLMIYTKDYIKRKGYKAKNYQSLVLSDPKSGDEGRVLENDMIIAMPGAIVTAECKSYKGALSILPPCTLHRSKGNDADVFKQTQSHLRSLKQYAEAFALPGVGGNVPLVSFCFVFSDGSIKDTREQSMRARLPVITLRNIERYYDSLFKKFEGKAAYDYTKMIDTFDKLNGSITAHNMHRSYVNY